MLWIPLVSITAKCLRSLSDPFSPNLTDQSSCKMDLVLACVVRLLRDDWSIWLGEIDLTGFSNIWRLFSLSYSQLSTLEVPMACHSAIWSHLTAYILVQWFVLNKLAIMLKELFTMIVIFSLATKAKALAKLPILLRFPSLQLHFVFFTIAIFLI